jgi:AcrR family transcriptional regulator
MPRRYDMTTRGRAAAGTRREILEAAHRLLNQRDATALTLQEVAAAAGVSRAAIYKSVGSRRALLAAVFEDQGRLIRFDRVLAAIRLDDPASAVIATIRESCRAWSVMPAAIRRTLALAVVDPEIGRVVRKYERHRAAEMRALAARAHRTGALAPGLTVDAAAATLTLLSGFAAFDQLRDYASARAAASHLLRMIEASLGIRIERQPSAR